MTRHRLWTVLTLPVLLSVALAACSGGGADTDGDGKISKEEVAKEAESIKFSPGEWENKVEIVDVKFDESKLPPEAKGMTGAAWQENVIAAALLALSLAIVAGLGLVLRGLLARGE